MTTTPFFHGGSGIPLVYDPKKFQVQNMKINFMHCKLRSKVQSTFELRIANCELGSKNRLGLFVC